MLENSKDNKDEIEEGGGDDSLLDTLVSHLAKTTASSDGSTISWSKGFSNMLLRAVNGCRGGGSSRLQFTYLLRSLRSQSQVETVDTFKAELKRGRRKDVDTVLIKSINGCCQFVMQWFS